MPMFKKFILIIVIFSAALSGLYKLSSAAKQETTLIKVGSYITPGSIWGKEVAKAMAAAKKRTSGQIEIRHLHSGMLGSNKSMLEQVLVGGIQAAGVETSTLANLVPEINAIELPFLFRDRDEAYYLIDTVIAPELKIKLEEKGLVTSALMELGFLDFLMPGAIHTPEDLKNKKIGAWESPVNIEFWKAEKGIPIPIPATEVMSTYARGMVDSGCNSVNGVLAWDKLFGSGLKRNKLYYTKINFSYHAGILVFNKKFFYSLPKGEQTILREELNRLTINIRQAISNSEQTAYAQIPRLGYNYYEMTPSEKAVFEKNALKVHEKFKNQIGAGFYKKIMDARSKYRSAHLAPTR